jgi:hypothetical protein
MEFLSFVGLQFSLVGLRKALLGPEKSSLEYTLFGWIHLQAKILVRKSCLQNYSLKI